MWFDFNLTMFLHSCVLPIHVNQTTRLTEILCFQMLFFARAFLSYSCVFPVPAFIESSNSKEPLQIYFIFRWRQRKLCVLCPTPAVPSSTPPEVHHRQKHTLQQRFPLQTFFLRLRSSSPLPAATPTALPSMTEQMNLRTTQFRKRGRSLSCLLTLYIGYYYLLLYCSILSFELPMGLISSQQRIVSV